MLNTGDEYTGSFKGGKFYGKGKMSYQSILSFTQMKERSVYEGDWINGTRYT